MTILPLFDILKKGDSMAYIKGIFIQNIFNNSQNGYTVGLIRIKESDNIEYINKVITFTGIFDELKYKTTYKMEGSFIEHTKYGMQFQVTNYELVLPSKEEEIIDFLSSDLFPMGVKTAEKIVNKLGSDAINIIINDPSSLNNIPRLTSSKINKISEVLNDYKTTSNTVIELTKMGFNTKDAISILKKYHNPLKVINNNIYQVLDDIDISFTELDKIALSNNYLKDDERRLEALTIYLMNNITFNQGDTYLYYDEIYHYIKEYTDNITFEYILKKLSKQNRIVIKEDRYYLKEFYDAEHYIMNRLTKLNDTERRKLPKLEDKIKKLSSKLKIEYDESQKEAIIKSLNNNLTIITGGPGTGKTTIIKCIVSLLIDIMGVSKDKLALLSPTGRAARKLTEVTNIKASTIHKYLKWDKESNTFSVDEYNQSNEEYIIIDEASMIDTILLFSLLKGTKEKAKYIFIGDYYQLPSVGQGQVLKDLIDSDCLDVITLKKLYRRTEDSYITTLAYEIKNKELSENYQYKYDDYNFISCRNEEILNVTEDIITKALKKGYTEKDIQVLAPIYKTTNGIDSLNKMLQSIMNPPSKNKNEILSGETIYREGDKILQLVNDSDNSISNGDIGYIESIITEKNKRHVVINFDGTRVTYTPKDFINIMHGYAISVHKSQGSEFKLVIIPFSNSFKRMLYNKLIYTAVTRAKEKLILIGDPQAFIYSIKNDYVEQRKTTLKELIENKYN